MSAAAAIAPDAERRDAARIDRLRRRYQDTPPRISIQRARLYTAGWRRSAGRGLARVERVALAMRHVYRHMDHQLDGDERIAGAWTEHFFGVPIDIERGVFNQVLEAELSTGAMLRHRGRSLAKALGYLLRKRALLEFARNQRRTRSDGRAPLDVGLTPMTHRAINAFAIDAADRRELLDELLPYWRGRCMVDVLQRELERSGLYSADMHDFVTALPGNTSRQVMMVSPCATIATLQGHVILDYDRVLARGLLAMRDALAERRAAAERDAGGRRAADLRGQELALEGVMIFARRLAAHVAAERDAAADPRRRAELDELAARCARVPLHPAASFAEALQALWTVKTAVELAHPMNLHCFGRLDQSLQPFYQADRDAGRIDAAGARMLLEELLLKIMSQNIRPESGLLSNFYHRFLGSAPVTVGGQRPDGGDASNAVTELVLAAAHGSKAVTNVSLRVHPGTPQRLLDAVAAYLAAGTASFSLFNDQVQIEALERRGVGPADARDYAVMGCVETCVPGKTGSMGANALLLTRLLDMTLRNGDARLLAGTIRGAGPRTGAAADFERFDDFKAALLRQGRAAIAQIAAASNLRDAVMAEQLPAPLISAFIDGCADSGADVTRGGARYDLSGISMINSIANLADSLHVIRELVFEQRRFSLQQLLRAIDADFEGCGDMLRRIRQLPGKWGNGDPRCDGLAAEVMGALFAETYGLRSTKGGPFVVYVISMITHTLDGRLSIASPDGRRAGVPFAASCNPANVERCGLTAALRSVAALPLADVMGSAVNVKLHPSAVGRSPAQRAKFVELLRTYFDLGGAQLQPTCASAEMLRAAQQQPEEYRDLVVKVGGYSSYFTELGPEIQQEIIDRTEHA